MNGAAPEGEKREKAVDPRVLAPSLLARRGAGARRFHTSGGAPDLPAIHRSPARAEGAPDPGDSPRRPGRAGRVLFADWLSERHPPLPRRLPIEGQPGLYLGR